MMRVLQVIHGYPPYYMAGSEVYTYNLTKELSRHAEMAVFTRVENPYKPSYTTSDTFDNGVLVRRVNKPSRDYTLHDKYEDGQVDDLFRDMMNEFRPDVVHIGHLSHLSTNIPVIAQSEFNTPVVFTAHDFWMGCYKGQLINHQGRICEGPSKERCAACAKHIYKEWFQDSDIEDYFRHMESVMTHIDLFLAPSKTLKSYLLRRGVPENKVVFSPYGFNQEISNRVASESNRNCDSVRFGFMGRIIPVKGIDLLIKAFTQVKGRAELSVFGYAGNHESYLKEFCKNDDRVIFEGAYDNCDLASVLNSFDILVVPSVWLENAPLVIQEAHMAGVPVITSDAGGMAELVRDGIDGFLFPLGDERALWELMQRIVNNPAILQKLRVDSSRVRSIEDDALGCLAHYRRLYAPERITFITNPGLCNLACPMCDTHSPYNADRAEQKRSLPILDYSIIDKTVRELVPLGLKEIIPSTMGEPLLYPQFGDLLSLAEETGVSLNLTTNATFPKGGADYWADKLLPVLSDVKFSINAIDSNVNESIMKGACTKTQLDNIKRFLSLRDKYAMESGKRCTVTLQMTFMRSNVEHVSDVLHWAISHGVDRLKGHHLWVTWPEMEEESLKSSDELIKRWNEVVDEVHEIAYSRKLPGGECICLANITPLDSDSDPVVKGSCPFIGKEAWVEADGTFQVCCCPSDVRQKFGSFGTLQNESLKNLWRSEAYRSFVACWGDHENCRICNMRNVK